VADRIAHAELVALVFGAVGNDALSRYIGGVRKGSRSGGRKSGTSGQQRQVSTGDLRQPVHILVPLVGTPNLNRNSGPNVLGAGTPDARIAQRRVARLVRM